MKTEKKSQRLEKNPEHCPQCRGYGWWAIGRLSPIGKGDASEWGMRVIKCPWCGAGYVEEGERWDALISHKKLLEGKNE